MGGTLYFKTEPSILGGDFMVSICFFGVMGQSNRLVAQKNKKNKIVETPDPN
jgi:hypothetical protein